MPSKRKHVSNKRASPAKRGKHNPPGFVPGRDRISGVYKRFGRHNGGELKYYDNTAAGSATDWSVAGDCILEIPKGTSGNERIGRKIVLKSIDIKASAYLKADLIAESDIQDLDPFIVKIVQDKQCNQTAALDSEILESVTKIDTFNLMENTQRFKTICTMQLDWKSLAGVVASTDATKIYAMAPNVYAERHIDLNMPITYDTTAGAVTVANVMSNNLLVLIWSGSSAGPQVGHSIETRVRYQDD